jgi:hypothetical protein
VGLKSLLSRPFAALVARSTRRWSARPVETQEKMLRMLVQQAGNTAFGKDHNFAGIRSYGDFKRQVPLRDYEGFREYIERIKKGERNVLWKGLPLYFSKTSGTTSGTKYIPITRESIPYHISAARDALLLYIHETGRSGFTDKRMIFLSGSPELDRSGKIPTGRLSGIVNHFVPAYLKRNQLPSYATNCIEDWEEKVDRIVDETIRKDMGLISGIPPWVQMYFDRIRQRSGKPIAEVFRNFSLFVYGGVNYEPYRKKVEETIGRPVDSIELYPASEGFIAFQDSQKSKGMLLLLNSGMFYEFIPASEYFSENPRRLSVGEVELGVNYALILSTNAGLWGYSIGDTVKFVSLNPHKIVVTGRIKHFLSAFGEHVIGEEVERALQEAMRGESAGVVEYTVAPQVTPSQGLPYHEWLIEFSGEPTDLESLSARLDDAMQRQNIYYRDLVAGSILRPLRITPVQKGGFIGLMKEEGKLGGQNKVPRLSNDRQLADKLNKWLL